MTKARTEPRTCSCCGEHATNTSGPPRCDSCRKSATPKWRRCECGAHFRTRNNSTRCNSCSYRRRKSLTDKRCSRCGTAIDYRSRNCPKCMNRNGGSKPIGSRYTHPKTGYVEIKTERGWAREHVVVMEQLLGRQLLPGESVHHKNGVRDDNQPENLELWVRPQPSGVRVEDALAWAHALILRYEVVPKDEAVP